ncbi:hypothetical protein WICPIJ_007296 [Wickerhamomyces pijperi]|uniref:Phosphatidic acid phosphatase type 2/haloperoxidase domain-containing protein n=1 Tax=Wickerhamomyces pijperi TaxID=599730 RepID=A0A9P8Q028_WICPI|nr:hypothetical protein WICPIJ_007296 [Wickerhamomyces pijperi]
MSTSAASFPSPVKYIPDLLYAFKTDYLIIPIVLLTSFYVEKLPPAQKYVNIYDSRIQYPYHEDKFDTVPTPLCFFYAVILPLGIVILMELIRVKFNVFSICKSKKALFRVHGLIFGFVFATLIDLMILVFLKMWISQPRPDFISRCEVNSNLIKTGVQVYKVSEICMNSNKAVLMEGLRSTPSGHSAISFTGLNYLSLYLFSNFQSSSSSSSSSSSFSSPLTMFKILVGYSPLYLAVYIATSRLADYKHTLFDISFGSTIGVIISILVWRHYDKRSIVEGEDQQHGFVRVNGNGTIDESQPILPL